MKVHHLIEHMRHEYLYCCIAAPTGIIFPPVIHGIKLKTYEYREYLKLVSLKHTNFQQITVIF